MEKPPLKEDEDFTETLDMRGKKKEREKTLMTTFLLISNYKIQ